MKKLLSIACVCAVGAVWAADTEIKCGNDVGTLEISSTATNVVVSVPFGELATGSNICASNIVKTANLTENDELYVYNAGSWTAWKLAQATAGYLYWQSVGTATINDNGQITLGSSPAPNETYLATGSAIWLKRQHPEIGKIHVYGCYKQELSTSVTKDVNNLVANPTDTAMAIVGAETGDVVKTIASSGLSTKQYTRVSGGWTTVTLEGGRPNVVTLTDGTVNEFKLPAGQGVWYKPKSTRTITWRAAVSN